MLWYILFFLVALKIPLVYLCYVVWWAVKDPPQPGDGFEGLAGAGDGGGTPDQGDAWWKRRTPRRPERRGPHGSPVRHPEPTLTRARSKPPV